ncbi:Protein ecm33 [Smittium mucronatum]|uniref:Protein ecm33 n=1 Tax=Smittium mucronatum TaxID=133383 RepID=A0A1R0GQ91_9FUNG|nr:Protein ecm33 [Smittium mucronatum]
MVNLKLPIFALCLSLVSASQADIESVSSCSKIVGSVVILDSALSTIDLSNIEEIEGGVYVLGTTNLTSLKMDSLKSLTGDILMLKNSGLTDFSAKSLSNVNNFNATLNPNLRELNLSSLSIALDFYIFSNSVSALNINSLLNARDVTIILNSQLEFISFQKLTSCSGSLSINGNFLVPDVQLPSLTQVQKNIIFSYISNLNASLLSSNGGELVFSNNEIQEFSLDSLKSIGGSLTFLENDKLKSFEMPELTTIGKGLLITDNSEPLSIQDNSFPKLASIGGMVVISGNIKTFNLPEIKNVIGNVVIQSFGDFNCNNKITQNPEYISGFGSCKWTGNPSFGPHYNPIYSIITNTSQSSVSNGIIFESFSYIKTFIFYQVLLIIFVVFIILVWRNI